MPLFRISDNYHQLLDKLSIRKARRAQKAAMQAVGEKWHRDFLPLHFEPFSASKYRYKPRTLKWQRAKERLAKINPQVKKGGRVPNVFTGLLEESMERFATIRAFPSRATVTMRGPRYISMRPYKSNQPDKAAEITRVIPSEERTLAKVAGEVLDTHFQ